MRPISAVALTLSLTFSALPTSTPRANTPAARANENTSPAGTLKNGVLTLAIEARRATWFPDGDAHRGIEVAAFSEDNRAALIPGPLVRVPVGTTVRLSVHNALGDSIAFHVPPEIRGAATPTEADSLVLAPGERSEVDFVASVPGTYFYRARTNDRIARALTIGGLMAGAIVVDSAGTGPPRDRVIVLLAFTDSVVGVTPAGDHLRFSLNGRSWPNTERIAATVGDTLHWRVINANNDVHPMHLHGFYYRVDGLTGGAINRQGQGAPGRMVVTERMPPFTAMSLTWVPERAGNWLFHCHFQVHVARRPSSGDADGAHENHALTGMQGLVLGIVVRPRPGAAREVGSSVAPRRLRLIATQDSAFPASAPSMRFLLEDRARTLTPISAGPGFSPSIVVERGKPLAIMVVNRLNEPTVVHWHGIELDNYYDGVAGFGGDGNRVSPMIAPRDSFEARFTPPRTGTFIYHSHANEPRQHRAGLLGALIVVDSLGLVGDDHTFFLKSARAGSRAVPVLDINGQVDPDTVVLHVGQRARLRFISLALLNPNARVILTARVDSAAVLATDSLVVEWRPLAKDGADLPLEARAPRIARQIIGIGETYDFEFTPTTRGPLRMEVRGGGVGALLGRVPMRVE
jgi:FtsP/CotA-like multicopper oxidase with cupredoxin domain